MASPLKSAGNQAMMVGMQGGFSASLNALVAASGGRLYLKSGFRSRAKQAALYEAGKKKRGKDVRKWVAPPGHSNHERGIAADLGGDLAWAHKNAARFGLYFPMSHEPWHVEPVGSRSGSSKHAYTEPGAMPSGSADTFIRALIGQESGGNVAARNGRTGAMGLGQILPSNYPSWAKDAGVDPRDRSGNAQLTIIRHKVNQYFEQFGNWRDVAIAWYAGPGAVKGTRNRDKKQGKGNEPSINEYANRVMARMGLAKDEAGKPLLGDDIPATDNKDITTHLTTLASMLGSIGDPLDNPLDNTTEELEVA